MNLGAGNTQTITVSAFDTQNATIANPGTPTFTVAQSAIAEVDGQGVVLGLTQGTTTISVSLTMGAVTKTATVTVSVSGTLPDQADVIASSGDYVFTPKNVAIVRGGSVTWTFGVLEHTVTFANTAGAPASISSGGYSSAVSRTFVSAGNFAYTCTIHAGMSGQVVVR
jgi:plastocyanin